jgi:hypothetical protein
MGGGILIPPVLQELKELFGTTLLKQSHQRTPHSFHLSAGHFRYLTITVYEATCDLLELKIPCYVRVHEDLGQFTRSNDELRDEIDCVISVTTEL